MSPIIYGIAHNNLGFNKLLGLLIYFNDLNVFNDLSTSTFYPLLTNFFGYIVNKSCPLLEPKLLIARVLALFFIRLHLN